jgi:hypothetical protein
VPTGWLLEGISPEGDARGAYYGISVVPTNMFDGVHRVEGGTYATYLAAYNNRRVVPSPLRVEFLARSYAGNKASVKARITLEQDVPEGVVCHVILWEDKADYNGHLWRFVERKMPAYGVLTITKKGQQQTIKREFALDAGWKKANLGVTVIVQRLATRAVLNGRATRLVEGVAVEPASLGRVKALFD